jgi:hypothetical protein|tara:strand:- start:3144 stop:3974 length:831 start_codon:yes stop_codon:yes gene_type:complete
MKTTHNKKRNTAFVYEALIKEMTASILKKDHKRKRKVTKILKKYFKTNSVLSKDLECYKSLYEKQNVERELSERILRETKLRKRLLDPSSIFDTQTEIINDINKELEPSVFGNFVPNYKTLASIAQIFSDKVSPRDQVLLENEILNEMTTIDEIVELDSIDNLIYRKFVSKFNEKYDGELLEEQKRLLTYYISSFTDNALELKVFLNEEIDRLKTRLLEAAATKVIKEDPEMIAKTNRIVERLESFSKEGISDQVLLTVMKTQNLIEEIHRDGDSN